MKYKFLVEAVITLLLFIGLTALLAFPFFLIFQRAIVDKMSIFMIIASIILIRYRAVSLEKKSLKIVPSQQTLVSLSLIISCVLLYYYLVPNSIIDSFEFNSKNVMSILSMSILGPISEEIVFRFLILKNLLCSKNIFASIFVTSVLFSIMHYNSVGIFPLIFTFFISIILSYNFVRKESLVEVILLHALSNIISLTIPLIIKL
jgi:hypothetical protein